MTDPATTARSEHLDDERDEDASEAQAQVIASLRAQVTDLFSQVTQLNSKLVASYDRVSDLEDQLHDTSSSLRNASVTVSALELERSHHLAALNTGLLVEKAHVTAELNRLMEHATEEAAQRGQAETARRDIEKDLDELSASLFDQANTMVAEARLNQAQSERKVRDAEQALKIAEDAVRDMQVQMQALQSEKEAADREAREAKITMGKGKWVERDDDRIGDVPRIRFMTTHTPYAEFIAFVGHLRGLRASQPTPPVITTLLSQPFVTRLLNEDSEPTVRLDLAPSLNWLSRRSVLAAIHTGMLTVEPMPFSSLVQELHQHPQFMPSSSLSCALCGTLITRLPSTPVSRTYSPNGNSWFKYSLALSSPQNHSIGTSPTADCEPPGQVYIFRLFAATPSVPQSYLSPTHTSSASMSAAGPSSRPPLNAISSSRVIQAQTHNSPYPLCTSNYCLTRLRSTCSLWAFVRVGIVERMWEEEVVQPSKPPVDGDAQATPLSSISAGAGNQGPTGMIAYSASEKPPVPPRRRKLWEMASALGERAVSWGKESGENTKEREKESTKKMPPPPPSHPSVPHPHAESFTSGAYVQEPPPLPKRNAVRGKAITETAIPPSGTQSRIIALEENKEPVATTVNGHVDPDKATPDAVDPPSTPDEATFATPPFESSTPPPTATSDHESGEPAPPNQDHTLPPSPHAVPLPTTPTSPAPTARVSSPVLRPRSHPSSPAPPSPGSRPASPALSRSRAGSPASAGIPCATSPSPGHAPSVSQIRGKLSASSPLAPPSRPASPGLATGMAAPQLPRRAPARRAVPPPPTSGPKGTGEGGTEGVMVPTGTTAVIATVPVPGPDERKASEGEVAPETKSGDTVGDRRTSADVIKEAGVSRAVPADPGPAQNVTAGDVERAVNETSVATVALDPHPSSALESDGSVSMDTTSTKQSSSTESEGFASNATWEERTWRELVRLKEDMFWARIGGIRALQGCLDEVGNDALMIDLGWVEAKS